MTEEITATVFTGPMYWVALSGTVVCQGLLVLDRTRLRQLLPAGLASIVLSGAHLIIDSAEVPLRVHDTGELWNRVSISFLQQMVVAPIMGMWFAQGSMGDGRVRWWRPAQFAAMAVCIEAMGVSAGRISYAPHWNPAYSAAYYTLWYAVIWWIQSYCTTATRRSPIGKAPPG